jgi:hypothetical protein
LFILNYKSGANGFITSGNLPATAFSAGFGTFSDGLLAADALCTRYAATAPNALRTYNSDGAGGTVAFKALLSSTTVDAISRITPNVNIQAYRFDGADKKQCLAANVLDLFSATDGLGYLMNGRILDENGEDAGPNLSVWTSIGRPVGQTLNGATATAEQYGGRYHPPGVTPPGGDYSGYASSAYCSNYKSASNAQSGGIGLINQGSSVSNWYSSTDTPVGACNNGYRLYCVSAQPFAAPTQPPSTPPPTNPPTPGGAGDPQFTGLQGQTFQVHGMPDEFFNLITHPTFQLNSRFAYLASGSCSYNNTECWTHPGTYVDQLGFMFPGINIKTVAGPHHKGLRVWINDEEMMRQRGALVLSTTTGVNATGAGEVSISHRHHDTLVVSSSLFTVEVTNSDMFFNFHLMFHMPEILEAGRDLHYLADSRAATKNARPHYTEEQYPTFPMHGLVGQTWKNARYAAKRMYQGEVDDYMLLDHQLFSTQFLFNLFAF